MVKKQNCVYEHVVYIKTDHIYKEKVLKLD